MSDEYLIILIKATFDSFSELLPRKGKKQK